MVCISASYLDWKTFNYCWSWPSKWRRSIQGVGKSIPKHVFVYTLSKTKMQFIIELNQRKGVTTSWNKTLIGLTAGQVDMMWWENWDDDSLHIVAYILLLTLMLLTLMLVTDRKGERYWWQILLSLWTLMKNWNQTILRLFLRHQAHFLGIIGFDLMSHWEVLTVSNEVWHLMERRMDFSPMIICWDTMVYGHW